MDTRQSLTMILGICGILVLAVGLPLGIYFSFRRSRGPSAGEVLTRAGKGARQPWSDEDAALAKLSNEVNRLKQYEEPRPPVKPTAGDNPDDEDNPEPVNRV